MPPLRREKKRDSPGGKRVEYLPGNEEGNQEFFVIKRRHIFYEGKKTNNLILAGTWFLR